MSALRKLHEQALELTAQEEAKVLSILGRTINIRSRKCQLLPLLQEMGITYQGAPLATTDKKILPLVDQAEHPVIQALLDWSSANEEQKQLKQWLGKTDPSTGQSYPQANQFGTVTHRFSYRSSESSAGQEERHPSDHCCAGGSISSCARTSRRSSWSLRRFITRKRKFWRRYAAGLIFTLSTASQIFRRPSESQVTEKQRDLGKLTNLSRIYGTGLEGFIHRCRLAGVTLSQRRARGGLWRLR